MEFLNTLSHPPISGYFIGGQVINLFELGLVIDNWTDAPPERCLAFIRRMGRGLPGPGSKNLLFRFLAALCPERVPLGLGLLDHAFLALADEAGHGDDLLALLEALGPDAHGHPAEHPEV